MTKETDSPSPSFLEDPTGELRQGDICFDWPFPKWQLTSYQVASPPPLGSGQPTALLSLHERGSSLPLVICSHDCDLDNPRNRLGFIVAPIIPWPSGIDIASEKGLTLVSSHKPSENGYDYIQLYPLKLPGEDPEWRVADFSAMTSLSPPTKLVPILQKAKRFEMTDETRDFFGTKLAAFFIR